ncbi:hypothetical protein PEC106568_07480 [Pectobacterium carotovorum subsp. carotovorum]|nr:hypothetical protein PEC106568_07480 [Pectobacterium carotovorum subsp. carotovorum]
MVTRYKHSAFQDRTIHPNENGDYVKYTDYAELERQRDALVAELSSLKGFSDQLIEMHNGLNGSGGGIYDEGSITYQQAALDAAMDAFDEIQTPTTDAALREIGAKAVDEFSSEIGEMYQRYKPNTIQAKALKCVVMHAVGFAQRLREGKV